MHPENKSWKIIFKHINTGHVIFALTFLTAKSILALTLHKLNPGDLKTTLLTAFSLALLLSLIFIIALAFFNKEKEKNSQNNDKHPISLFKKEKRLTTSIFLRKAILLLMMKPVEKKKKEYLDTRAASLANRLYSRATKKVPFPSTYTHRTLS